MDLINLDSLANLPAYLVFLTTGFIVWLVGITVYLWITPIRELEEIRKGNIAVAIHFLAVSMALALPIQSVGHSTFNPGDMILWGGIGILSQILLHAVVRIFWKTLYARLTDPANEKGCIAAALALSALSLVVGLLNASALSY
ncbi:DUF350 domain-containing protein [Asticcacaulis sp. BYS171W]|uniref:DUF350 domain-containing protein n=1 Tax=Asticcacaulis aquaticus TaxID=2984212 RepID=A0ABT5HXN4_9CAUL|nr:DUF350 domain-containing protein [Asticcacaulis aquaticus]MDC7684835.1 DUF350 domain-containing protein [Asticcacaulis aquaticus]